MGRVCIDGRDVGIECASGVALEREEHAKRIMRESIVWLEGDRTAERSDPTIRIAFLSIHQSYICKCDIICRGLAQRFLKIATCGRMIAYSEIGACEITHYHRVLWRDSSRGIPQRHIVSPL